MPNVLDIFIFTPLFNLEEIVKSQDWIELLLNSLILFFSYKMIIEKALDEFSQFHVPLLLWMLGTLLAYTDIAVGIIWFFNLSTFIENTFDFDFIYKIQYIFLSMCIATYTLTSMSERMKPVPKKRQDPYWY